MNCSSALGELHAAQGLTRGRSSSRSSSSRNSSREEEEEGGVSIVSQGEHVPHILREREPVILRATQELSHWEGTSLPEYYVI
jgi:hypothetical protein